VTHSSSSSPSPPNKDRASWACVDRNGTVKVTFTPDQVCVFQYRQVAHAVVGTLTNPGTWKCYK
jgi:hypothetical protein